MRLPVALLSVVAVPASVLAAPVVTPSAPAPRAVAPEVHEVELPVADEAVAEGSTARRTLVSTPQQRTEPFSTVGVTWLPDEDTGDLRVNVRTRSEGAWTPWTPLEAEGPELLDGAPEERRPGVRAGTEPLYAGPSDAVQVRVEVLSGEAPRDLRLALVDPGSSPADAVSPTVPASTAHAELAQPPIRSRAQWGADESIRTGTPSVASTLSAVTLHHTASSNDYTAAEVPSLLRGFYAYHVKSQGWSDIGYNVLVDKFGTAWEGRAGGLDKPVIGAHAGGFNTGTAGVSMIGTYGTVEPSAAMKETVAQVAAWKLGLHGRDPKGSVTLKSGGSTRYPAGTSVTLPRVFGHRDVSTTACPGDRGVAALPGIRERAAAIQASAPTTAPAPEPVTDPSPEPPGQEDPDPAPTPAPTPAPPAKPFGALDSVTGSAGTVRAVGWTIDPDAPSHTVVQVRVDGAVAGSVVANLSRPDLKTHFPQYSSDHGYEAVVKAAPGTREVCVTALDAPGTDHVVLGCRTVQVTSGDPIGLLERARATADVVGVRVTGWALDPDAGSSSPVVVRVDDADVSRVLADVPRVDVAAATGDASGRRGFDQVVPAPPGARRVCALALNQGLGVDTLLGCVDVDVPARPAPAAPPGARPVDDSCPAGVPAGGFKDTASSVHRAAVDCAVWWQLTGGVTPDRYDPTGRLTRGQVASFLARLLTAAGASLPASPPDAFDDDRGSPHERAVNQMAALGVVGGKGARRYDPAGTVSRDQMASYLVRAYEQHVGAPLPDGGDWYRDDDGSVHEKNIGRAARAGFTGGTGPGRYAPLALTDRGQVASFLTRLLDMLVEHGRAPRRG